MTTAPALPSHLRLNRVRRAVLVALVALPAAGADAYLTLETADLPAAGNGRAGLGLEAWSAVPNPVSGDERTTIEAPILAGAWSPGDTVRLDARVPLWTMQIRDAEFGTGGDFGDITLGTSWRLRAPPGVADGFLFGLRWQVTLPETSDQKGLGPNTTRFQGTILAGWRIGGFRADVQTGLAIHPEPGYAESQNDLVPWGIGVRQSIGRVAVHGQALGLAGRHQPGADAHGELRVGVVVPAGRWEFAVDLRRGLTNGDGRWGSALAAALLFK